MNSSVENNSRRSTFPRPTRSSHRLRTGLLTVGASIFLLSCGASSSDNEDDVKTLCEVQLTPATQNFTGAYLSGESIVSYTGTIPSECQKKTNETSGRAQINVAAQSKASTSSIAMKELKAGNRSVSFDPTSDNFVRGTVEKRFDSSFYPQWSFPWSDNPALMTLSMTLADGVSPASLPATVTVELIN